MPAPGERPGPPARARFRPVGEVVLTLQIDVISDVVCPWCYVGKRKLARALELYREHRPAAGIPRVVWHAFQLNPDMPESGMDRSEYVARKFGPRAKNVYDRVTAVGAAVGIPFAFEKVTRQPNTLAAHSLIALAADSGRQDDAVEAFFNAYFVNGRDLTSRETLVELGREAGLAQEDIQACLDSAAVRDQVRAEDEQARAQGVEGVPFFIINRRFAISGAQDPEVLLDAMLKSDA